MSYGPGSPFGAHRVVLHDFRPFVEVTAFDVTGSAEGGTITLTVAGVAIVVATTPGQSAEEVAAALAEAIRASQALASQGIAASDSGNRISINAGASPPTVTDPGLVLTSVLNVPSLPGVALAMLAAVLAVSGRRSVRRREACPSDTRA